VNANLISSPPKKLAADNTRIWRLFSHKYAASSEFGAATATPPARHDHAPLAPAMMPARSPLLATIAHWMANVTSSTEAKLDRATRAPTAGYLAVQYLKGGGL